MRNDWWQNYAGAWPWSGRRRFFETGEVRLAILSLLFDGPKNGYQLMKELEERSGGLYRASAGSVYPTLQQLEDEGLIAAGQQEGKRVFDLTDAGRAVLEKDPDAVKRIWDRAEKWEEWGQCLNPESLHLLKPPGRVHEGRVEGGLAGEREAGSRRAADADSGPGAEGTGRSLD